MVEGEEESGPEEKEMEMCCCLSQKPLVSCGGKKEGVCSRVYLLCTRGKGRFLSVCGSSFFVLVHVPFLRGCSGGYVRVLELR